VIAEGHPLTASLIAAALRRRGRDVVVVHDGREALRSVESLEPALLVCDLVLPGMSGFELLAQVGERGHGEGLRRLVLSSLPSALEQEARRAGADAFLTKPFDPAVLAELVDVLLDRQSSLEPTR
jgi:CheY-like chemotaxis protein